MWALLGLWLLAGQAGATHNRAGEITYTHVQGLTYEVVITTYTKSSAIADRPWLPIRWGDEVTGALLDSLERESIQPLLGDVQINVYRGQHTYGGPGVYALEVEDPNRNDGVLNIPGSVDVPFAIQTLLFINPMAGHNNSVQLLNPGQENACLFQPWIHNPGAFDPDGDLLTFALIACRGFDGEFIPGYVSPELVSPAEDLFAIDPVTGDLTWESPQVAGEYNLAIRVQEWRMVDGMLVQVGEVVRDMQVSVAICANQAPVVAAIPDTCVVADSFLSLAVSATDPDNHPLVLTALGGPLSEVEHPAFFVATGNGQGTLTWLPRCAEVREAPYQVLFKAQDALNATPLSDIESVLIRVIAPPVQGVVAQAAGLEVEVSWQAHGCGGDLPDWQVAAGGYEVYRRVGVFPAQPGACEVGLPAGWDYELVGTVSGLGSTVFVDTDALNFGATYCYRVVAFWPDAGPSVISSEACATIPKDVPVMTGASVEVTDAGAGKVSVSWSPPTDADLAAFPGPYGYKLYASFQVGPEGDWSEPGLLWESGWSGVWPSPDTQFVHTGIPTDQRRWRYAAEAWSGDDRIGLATVATTPFLTLTPNDNELALEVFVQTPWENEVFEVHRQDDLGNWVLWAESDVALWVDTGLVNQQSYCYRVRTRGGYDASGTVDPIVNWSQSVCGIPVDLTPPCPPVLEVVADCPESLNRWTWQNPEGCADDVQGYVLYWTPVPGGTWQTLAQWEDSSETTYLFNEGGVQGTIAGCFAVSAFDSLAPGVDGVLRRNFSALSEPVCVDNCPYYFLPNVFTPNEDGSNDVFQAFPWKFVAEVDFQLFNRNGLEVFRTRDPDIMWDGRLTDGSPCADGVYYYTVRVQTIRLQGRVEERFSGEIHLLGSRNGIQE
jgi:gliding motility-associated-like protein